MVGSHDQSNPQEPTLFDPDEDPDFGINTERLTALDSTRSESNDTNIQAVQAVATAADPYGPAGDPGLVVIFENWAPGRTELHVPHQIEPINSDGDTAMPDQAPPEEATETSDIRRSAESDEISGLTQSPAESKESTGLRTGASFDAHELQRTASAGLREQEAKAFAEDNHGENIPEKRHDSHQEQEPPPLSSDQNHVGSPRGSQSLTLVTNHDSALEESIATSPNLGKHVITMPSDLPETLAAFQPHSPTGDGNASSPQGGTLPPIHQIVTAPPYHQLKDLAEVATQQVPRTVHQHSPPFGSATSPSPRIPYHPFPGIAQMSPPSQHAYTARSPTSAFGDPYGSPTQYSHPAAYYPSRRSSAPTDRPPAPPPSIPSVSSGDSHGHASSIDGYSTAHTTPIDPVEATPRPVLPPPHGMVIAPGYKCDVPDCPAPPFQTQYLLRFASPGLEASCSWLMLL